MSHFVNANPLDYDAKYPQTADTSINDKAKIEIMEKNIGREAMFQIDGTQFYGNIISVPNSEKYCISVSGDWCWYVREDITHFVDKIY